MDPSSLEAAELRLQAAQRASDVDALDDLLHPDLVFVAPGGAVYTKADDLTWHRHGMLRLHHVEPEDLVLRVVDGVGVTVFTATMSGLLGGDPFTSRLR